MSGIVEPIMGESKKRVVGISIRASIAFWCLESQPELLLGFAIALQLADSYSATSLILTLETTTMVQVCRLPQPSPWPAQRS